MKVNSYAEEAELQTTIY